jgi:hypothetical protein
MVTAEESKQFAQDNNLKIIEVAAVTGQNVAECFDLLFHGILFLCS